MGDHPPGRRVIARAVGLQLDLQISWHLLPQVCSCAAPFGRLLLKYGTLCMGRPALAACLLCGVPLHADLVLPASMLLSIQCILSLSLTFAASLCSLWTA